MRAKKLFSILLAMMLMLFTLFPIQAVLAETTNQPSQRAACKLCGTHPAV